jgi:hypothetical protein
MNDALPPGNRGYRDSDPTRSSGYGGAVPGAGRLVGGIEAAAWEPEESRAAVKPTPPEQVQLRKLRGSIWTSSGLTTGRIMCQFSLACGRLPACLDRTFWLLVWLRVALL